MSEHADKICDYVETIIRPLVQADGGEIRFVSFEDDVLTVKMQGECAGCGVAGGCLKQWIADKVKKEFGRDVTVVQIFARPYFADR